MYFRRTYGWTVASAVLIPFQFELWMAIAAWVAINLMLYSALQRRQLDDDGVAGNVISAFCL